MTIPGSRAVVTGAARGIGRAIAIGLAHRGASVVAVDRDWSGDDEIGSVLGGPGGVAAVQGDVGADEPEELASRVVAQLGGPPSLIVHNAGFNSGSTVREISAEVMDRAWRVNVRDPAILTKEWVNQLIREGTPGAVLFVSSLHASSVRFNPDYSCTKAAVEMLMREFASDLGRFGIRVNAVAPGAIDTVNPVRASNEADGLIPLRRVGEPDDVASVAISLLDDDVSRYVTGAVWTVDGGLALYNWMIGIYGEAENERLIRSQRAASDEV